MAGLSFEMTIWRLFCCQPQVVQLHYSLVDDIILVGAFNADWRKIFILSSGDNDCLTMMTHNSTPAVTYGGDHSHFFSGYQSHVVEFFHAKRKLRQQSGAGNNTSRDWIILYSAVAFKKLYLCFYKYTIT